MIIDSYKEEDTFSFGEELGKKAVPGEIYALCGDLGVGKTVFTKGLAKGLGSRNLCAARLLRSYRSMRKADCHFIILMYTDAVILEEMDEIGYEDYSTETGSVLWNGQGLSKN